MEPNVMNASFTPVVYLKEGCPYSEKLLDFLQESELSERVDIVRCAAGTPAMDAVREKLSSATGAAPKFPTAEVEPGQFRTESDDLIRYFSQYAEQGKH